MPRNDTWRGRDAYQGWPRGSVLGGWGGAARGGSAGVALAVGRGLAADRRGPDRVGTVAAEVGGVPGTPFLYCLNEGKRDITGWH